LAGLHHADACCAQRLFFAVVALHHFAGHHAPITGLIENSDSWLGVIRRIDMAKAYQVHRY
jgi:hypothetical protein